MEAESPEIQSALVDLLEEHSIVFSVSQLPEIRRQKAVALKEINSKLRLRGVNMTENQLHKKILNMKCRVKMKLDFTKTGKRRPDLKDWEKKLLVIMQANTQRTIRRIPGAVVVGFGAASTPDPGSAVETISAPEAALSTQIDFADVGPSSPTSVEEITPDPCRANEASPSKRKRLEEYETDVTRDLTAAELARLIKLRQLEVLDEHKKQLQLHQRVLKLQEEMLQWQRAKQLQRHNSTLQEPASPHNYYYF